MGCGRWAGAKPCHAAGTSTGQSQTPPHHTPRRRTAPHSTQPEPTPRGAHCTHHTRTQDTHHRPFTHQPPSHAPSPSPRSSPTPRLTLPTYTHYIPTHHPPIHAPDLPRPHPKPAPTHPSLLGQREEHGGAGGSHRRADASAANMMAGFSSSRGCRMVAEGCRGAKLVQGRADTHGRRACCVPPTVLEGHLHHESSHMWGAMGSVSTHCIHSLCAHAAANAHSNPSMQRINVSQRANSLAQVLDGLVDLPLVLV